MQETHGAPADSARHVGDLGNIFTVSSTETLIEKEDFGITLYDHINGILGRGVVIHAGRDDLGQGGDDGSLATGNAGGRVACGVIEVKRERNSASVFLACI